MLSVRQLFASMIAILPSAMMLENWNSTATQVWSKNRKSLTPKSIDEFVNVKVNGPPNVKYDLRDVAGSLSKNSRDTSIDLVETFESISFKYIHASYDKIAKESIFRN